MLEVDLKRQRVALSMRLDDVPGAAARRSGVGQAAQDARPARDQRAREARRNPMPETRPSNAMALALAKLKK